MPTPKLALDDDRERMSAYANIRVFESDYDRAQNQLRVAASTWIIAAVGAILGVFAAHNPGGNEPAVPVSFIAGLICFLASFGLAMLWTVDQRVYQRLLHSAFAYGLAVEMRNPDLPQIRTAMYRINSDIGRELSVFYFAPIIVFTLFDAGFAAGFEMPSINDMTVPNRWTTEGLVAAANLLLLGGLFFLATSRNPKVRLRIDDLLPRFGVDVAAWFSEANRPEIEARLGQHHLPPGSPKAPSPPPAATT